jgi:polyhydroxyalkanoate synthesis regulator phasin
VKTDFVKELDYYSKPLFHSYSSLTRLLYSPQIYYKYYILEEREESLQPSLVEGKVIHCLILENEKFNDMFLVSPGKLPEGNNKLVVEQVITSYQTNGVSLPEKLSECKTQIISILKEIDLHQKLKTDEQRLEKIITDQNINYYDFIRNKGSKIVIDQETLERCSEAADLVKSNKEISQLLALEGFDVDPDLEVHNEKELRMILKDYPFGIKAVLDNYVIDRKARKIRINDLKTTSKSLHEFKDSIEFYKYYLQAAMQTLLVVANHPETEGYEVTFTFVVIDKYLQVYPFEVSTSTMLSWTDEFEKVITMAKWHYQTKRYDLPYEFGSQKVIL